MDKWDKVFTTGWHTDSNGNKKLWTTADLDRIVDTLNPSYHEPPVVIGHPSDNAPAFGWVAAAKRIGNDLYLKYKDVATEFTGWVQKGLFKKKSISVYPDGSLRHIGYLGAAPPAIKGLPDYQFSDGDRGAAVTYEFSDWRMTTMGRIFMRLRDYLVEKEGTEKADNIISSWDVQDMLTQPEEPDEVPIDSYTDPKEEEMKPEEVQKMLTDVLSVVTKQFSEQLKVLGEQNAKLAESVHGMQTEFAAANDAAQRREFESFCDSLPTRILPAEKPTIVAQMMNLRQAAAVEFSEGGEVKTRSAVDDYKLQLAGRAETVSFKEFATKDKARIDGKQDDASEFGENVDEERLKLHTQVLEYQEQHAGTTYADALAAVKKGGN